MFRNIYYDKKNSTIVHWTWNDLGERVEYRSVFRPYIYVPAASNKTYDYLGTDGVPLVKKEFLTSWDKNNLS